MKLFIPLLFLLSTSYALILDPIKAMSSTFSTKDISKKSMILSKHQHQIVQKHAKARLDSKLFRVYIAKTGTNINGYGILLSSKVRSKSATVLSMFAKNGTLQAVEIIAFNEPKEYMPRKKYTTLFAEKRQNHFALRENMPNISGATLSAQALVKLANLSQAIYEIVLK